MMRIFPPQPPVPDLVDDPMELHVGGDPPGHPPGGGAQVPVPGGLGDTDYSTNTAASALSDPIKYATAFAAQCLSDSASGGCVKGEVSHGHSCCRASLWGERTLGRRRLEILCTSH